MMEVIGQQQTGQNGHQRHGQDHRSGQRKDDGHCHWPKHLSFDPFERQDRQVDDHDDQFTKHRRPAHFDCCVTDPIEPASTQRIALAQMADTVLDHHNRAIDDQPKVDSTKAQ